MSLIPRPHAREADDALSRACSEVVELHRFCNEAEVPAAAMAAYTGSYVDPADRLRSTVLRALRTYGFLTFPHFEQAVRRRTTDRVVRALGLDRFKDPFRDVDWEVRHV